MSSPFDSLARFLRLRRNAPVSTEKQPVLLQPLPKWGNAGNSILGSHLANTDYLLATHQEPALSPEMPPYDENEQVWRGLIEHRIFPGMPVVLKQFMVFDWFPRSPGLYYTPDADLARQEAVHHLHRGLESPIRDSAGHSQRPYDYTVVFTPHGKTSMLEGGVGAIRLKPVLLFGEPHWLMTGSSDGITHTGVPLAVPRRFLGSLLPTIHENGAVCATIQGEVEFVPDPVSRLFDQVPMVPKVLIRVTSLERSAPKPIELENSVAVSFVSDYEGTPDVYASYVTFRPNVKGSFEDAIAWMKKVYVEGEYGGRIITDFDQTRTIFPEARLALRKVMDRQISRGELRETIELMHATASADSYYDEITRRELVPKRSMDQRKNIFISYAHAVEKQTGWVDRIRTHLAGLAHSTPFEVWTDAAIEPGQRWREEIAQAISRSRVAILVITADFLASSFIREAELPPLLEAAEADGTTIFCLYGSDVHLSGVAERLMQYQFVNDPREPLRSLTYTDREAIYKTLTQSVAKALS